ncbi:MAG: sulfatase [Polyangiaceae bacterium]
MKGAPAAPRHGPPRGGAVRIPEPARKRRSRPRALGSEPARRAPLFRGKLGVRIADAFLALAALLVAEFAVIGALHRSAFVTSREALSAGRVLPIAIVVAGPYALAVGALLESIAQANRPWARTIGALLSAVAAAALVSLTAPALGVRGAPELLAVLGLTGAAGFGAWFLGPRFVSWRARATPATRWGVCLGVAAGGAVVAELASASLTHSGGEHAFDARGVAALAWFGAAGIAAGVASLGRDPSVPKSARGAPIGAVCLFAAMAAIATPAARSLALADNVRVIFAAHAPLLGRAVTLAAEIAPPAPASSVSVEASPPLRGADVVLITVDALRADHLGAYGYDRPVSPAIDRLAASGVVFEEAYTSTPNTGFALASILTGKAVRPLVQLGLAGGARPDGVGETWARALARYGYQTAAFYPPSIFEAGRDALRKVAEDHYGFEFASARPASPEEVSREAVAFLGRASDAPIFLWAHFAAPNAPYQPKDDRGFGARDLDRYDAEIAEVDAAIGALVEQVRATHPRAVVILTAATGEEFGEHGGHYHGATVYEEQTRVPLVVAGPSVVPGRVRSPVQTIDVLPSILEALDIPRAARVRGRDVSAAFSGREIGPGFAFAETDTMSMVAEDAFRLVCFRRASACSLYNARRDAGETRDVTGNHPEVVARLRALLVEVEASHGRYEARGEGGEGAWPDALRRGIAGDGEAAADVAALLTAPSVEVRRRAAEVLFDLHRGETAPALKGAMTREEDERTRAFIALALTRLGESAPLTIELLGAKDLGLRRLAALALAEIGDDRGADELIRWWRHVFPDEAGKPREALPFARAREILDAFARIKPKTAIVPILDALADDELRPFVAKTLGDIGEEAARMPLSNRLLVERDQNTRGALLDALLRVHGGAEMVEPLIALLGMPDPLEHGLEAAIAIDMLRHVGGPQGDHDTARLRRFATSGVAVDFYIPRADLDEGVRILCTARSDATDGEIRVGRQIGWSLGEDVKAPVPKKAPELDPTRSMTIKVGASHQPVQVFGTAPASMDVHPGEAAHLVVYATQKVVVDACALVPLRSTLPTGRRRPD